MSAKNAAAEAAKKGARGVGRKIDQKLGKSNKSTVKIKLPRIGRL